MRIIGSKCARWLAQMLILGVSHGLAGCIEGNRPASALQPIAVFETDWPKMDLRKGKTQGPIQVRYRLEEYADRQFKLVTSASSSLKGLGPWQMELTGAKVPKLNDATSQLQKIAQEGYTSSVSRTFAFQDSSGAFDLVSVRVQVAVGDQLASRTLKVRLGPDAEIPVILCSPSEVCDRSLKAETRVE
jgi:hypothetical protein